MSNTKDFDILAINRETPRQVALQIKSNRSSNKDWVLSKNNEAIKGDNIYYVFLSLNELDHPEYYIVESDLVANNVKMGYELWLQEGNGKRKETNMRKFTFNVSKYDNYLKLKYKDYKNKWNKIK